MHTYINTHTLSLSDYCFHSPPLSHSLNPISISGRHLRGCVNLRAFGSSILFLYCSFLIIHRWHSGSSQWLEVSMEGFFFSLATTSEKFLLTGGPFWNEIRGAWWSFQFNVKWFCLVQALLCQSLSLGRSVAYILYFTWTWAGAENWFRFKQNGSDAGDENKHIMKTFNAVGRVDIMNCNLIHYQNNCLPSDDTKL